MLTFLVTGDVCVAVIRYGEVDTSCSTRQVQTLSDPFSLPVTELNPISSLTSYEQLSPASRQLSLICQAWICPTSLSETSGHEIPNSLHKIAD